MATSSFFFNGSNPPDQTETQTPPIATESTEDSVKTSFYYGSTPGPDQNTFNELVTELNSKIDQANLAGSDAKASASAAEGYAFQSQQAAILAANSIETVLAAEANAVAASSTAVQQVAEAEDLLDQANAVISSFTISTASPSGGEEGDVWFKISF